VKLLAILAATLALIMTASFSSAAAINHQRPRVPSSQTLRIRLPFVGRVRLAQASPLQTGGTPTATGTPGAAPTPTETPNTFPDAQTVLKEGFQAWSLIPTAHYSVVTNVEDNGNEHLRVAATGDAMCKNLALKGRLTATDTVEATSQTSKFDALFVRIKKSMWYRLNKAKAKWKTITKNIPTLGISLDDAGASIDNVLACPNSPAASGGSGGTDVLRDLHTVGPTTIRGTAVWHLQVTIVSTDTTGQTSQGLYDLYFSQSHFQPYRFVFATTESPGVTYTQSVDLSKFREKLKITSPIKKKK
jgi:hypothetical protein